MSCFAVNKETGNPQSHYDDNEHACLITGCDPQNDTVDIAHWGQTFKAISITDLFESMNALPAEREQEIYVRRDALPVDRDLNSPACKYDKEVTGQNSAGQLQRRSIVPAPNSGFKNKIFSIAPNPMSSRWRE